tara:strand:- start:876 stop:1118 length:243 start_codon:yes stop_codon:yes gene_type:complete
VLGPDQRISAYQALLAITRYAAYQHFEEREKGTLEVGKLADFVVLDRDPLSIPREELLDLQVEMTFSRGKLVFSQDRKVR